MNRKMVDAARMGRHSRTAGNVSKITPHQRKRSGAWTPKKERNRK